MSDAPKKVPMKLLIMLRRFLAATFVGVVTLLGIAAPAGALAPQPIDASEQGPLAFVAMTVMIVIFVFTLFYMDRIRNRSEQRDNHK